MEIPENTADNKCIDDAIKYAVNTLKKCDCAHLVYAERHIDREDAVHIADMFRAKGYHHEIRMHSNPYGHIFFYCLTISTHSIHSPSARYAWSEYVK